MNGDFLLKRFGKTVRRRGNRARDARRWPEAVAQYRRYLVLAPEDFAIWVQLGHALGEIGDRDGADQAYRAAARLAPEDADLLLCWGHLRKTMGDPAGARALYERSHAADGNADAARELEALGSEAADSDAAAEAGQDRAEEQPAGPSVGRIDRVDGRAVSGFALAPDEGAAGAVEFRAGDRVAGRVDLRDDRRHGEGLAFKTVLDVGPGENVSAHRMPDGAELAGSPFHVAGGGGHGHGHAPAWAARLEVVKELELPAARGELALFVTHSRIGALKPHVPAYLRELRAEGIAIFLVVVTDRPVNLHDDVLALVDGAVVRENAGYDFAAWSHVLKLYPEAYGASTLYLVNDSMVGPADSASFGQLIARIRASEAALIGLTESYEYRWHLQSYFLALKRDLLSSFSVQRFFDQVVLLHSKDDVIQSYEVRFATEMANAGHRIELLFPSHRASNPTLYAWRELIADGFPFIKLLLLRGTFEQADLTGWRGVLERAGFDVPIIDASLQASEEEVPNEHDDRLLARPHRVDPPAARPLKVAFYGPWNYDNGLGSASRGIIAAIRRTGVRLNIHPIRKPFHIHRPLGPPVDIVDFEGPADIAVVHLNPDSWFLLTDEQRDAIRRARKRIGYWVWEMAHIPPAWRHDFSSVDRIWTPSSYCARLFAAQDEAAVDVIPHPVPVPAPMSIDRRRLLAGLDPDAERRVILYVFDGSSYLVRKNPAALIRAFAASDLGGRGWTLVLKTKHLMDRPEEGRALRDLAEDTDDVLLIDRTMTAEELRDLGALADIYASPHCSEGFGLTIAEAMARGTPVIATDFGGSTDFLDADSGYPVRAHPWRLEEDFGHYTKGGVWARIDEPALVATLRRAAEAVEAGSTAIGDAGRARAARQLSYEAVGELIRRSFAATMTERGPSPAVRPIAPSLIAGVAIESADFGDRVRALPLARDGAPLPGAAGLPGDVPADRDHWVALAPTGSLANPILGRIVQEHARERPDVSIFYADDVAVETDNSIDQIRLKPAFDVTLLSAQDYVGAPLIVRASAFAALDGLRAEMRTAAVADLLFRAHAKGMSIARIPEVLLAHPGARVRASDGDYAAMLAAQPALADFDVETGHMPATFAIRRRFDAATAPGVTILVPTRRTAIPSGEGSYIERLLTGIAAADWPMDRLTVIVGDDVVGEPDWARQSWPFTLRRIETPRAPGEPFNYAAKMNRLWREAATEQIVFLNDDVQPRGSGWLKALQTFAVDEGVGGVGARLLFEDGRLQHAGMAPHGHGAAHVWIFRQRAEGTYQDWAMVHREWSMVTGAVFATRRSLMEQLDGFEEQFSLEFNDTDLCLRLRALGYRIVCTPDAEMVHVEKASRGEALPPGDDLARFLARWKPWLDDDPSWHPQLRRDRFDMTPAVDEGAWYF
jgi:glycosyltransferase involved in cell wall biosynthesis